MIERVLVAVDDSPPGLEALRWAVQLAGTNGAALRAVHVLGDGVVTSALRPWAAQGLPDRRRDAVQSLFGHVTASAAAAGVTVETVELTGEPAARILEQARSWPADVVVIGRGESRGAGGPWVGKETRMVLEFADQPVLVVPRTRHAT